jgi:hypothetical protein
MKDEYTQFFITLLHELLNENDQEKSWVEDEIYQLEKQKEKIEQIIIKQYEKLEKYQNIINDIKKILGE